VKELAIKRDEANATGLFFSKKLSLPGTFKNNDNHRTV